MSTQDRPRTVASPLNRLSWPLVAGLASLALLRPLFSASGLSDALGEPATPIVLTVVITLAWILTVGLSRVREPVLTLVAAGLAYAAAAIVLSGVLSPILDGEPDGPLAHPRAIVPVFLVNAFWGAVCGVCALGVRRLRGVRS
ncbi:hypothetical protein [Streptomyces albicerus]|uniref:hypothetical protein n=1 Tax=Streptomyces albicerus TaxID=2569859 RepID=UPI00124AE954|nr:hypothetical protein [Streptomyces albicerus]